MNLERIEQLKRKLWITRKSRINAAERLSKTDIFSQILINYYTLLILGMSIWIVTPNHANDKDSLLLVVYSVILFGITLFVGSRNYKGRSIEMKYCYIQMDQLYSELQLIEDDLKSNINVRSRFEILEYKYFDMLKSVENHSVYDFLLAIKNSDENITFVQSVQLLAYVLRNIAIGLFLLLVPIYFLILR